MSKIDVNIDGLTIESNDQLNMARNIINSNLDALNNVMIPHDFEELAKFEEIKSNVTVCLSNMDKIRDSISNAKTELEEFTLKDESRAKALPSNTVNKRDNLI